MRCFVGIDLGSTTTKAVVIDENQNVLGRGITNSRSNYDTAAAIAKQEALVNGRFHLFRRSLSTSGALDGDLDAFLPVRMRGDKGSVHGIEARKFLLAQFATQHSQQVKVAVGVVEVARHQRAVQVEAEEFWA